MSENMEAKRAVIYVRVSTVEQETDLQEFELKEYCERRHWDYLIYRDRGQSGANDNRPALTNLMNDIRRRKVDVIVIWALDRLARSLKHLLTIAEECKALGVDVVCLKQNIDTTLPAGRLTFQVLGAVAEFEREMLRERVKAGMEYSQFVVVDNKTLNGRLTPGENLADNAFLVGIGTRFHNVEVLF